MILSGQFREEIGDGTATKLQHIKHSLQGRCMHADIRHISTAGCPTVKPLHVCTRLATRERYVTYHADSAEVVHRDFSFVCLFVCLIFYIVFICLSNSNPQSRPASVSVTMVTLT